MQRVGPGEDTSGNSGKLFQGLDALALDALMPGAEIFEVNVLVKVKGQPFFNFQEIV